MHRTRFEKLAEKLGVIESEYGTSEELQEFAKQFKDVYYVPENLLKQWGLTTIYDGLETRGTGQ